MGLIETNDKGVPFAKPDQADFANVIDYLRACWAYRDTITGTANAAFDEAFRKSVHS